MDIKDLWLKIFQNKCIKVFKGKKTKIFLKWGYFKNLAEPLKRYYIKLVRNNTAVDIFYIAPKSFHKIVQKIKMASKGHKLAFNRTLALKASHSRSY